MPFYFPLTFEITSMLQNEITRTPTSSNNVSSSYTFLSTPLLSSRLDSPNETEHKQYISQSYRLPHAQRHGPLHPIHSKIPSPFWSQNLRIDLKIERQRILGKIYVYFLSSPKKILNSIYLT